MTLPVTITTDDYRYFAKHNRLPPHLDQPAKSTCAIAQVEPKPSGHRFTGLAAGRVATRGRMNGTEEKWAAALELERLAGVVRQWWFEPMKLRLTDPAPGQRAVYFTADFLVWLADGGVLVDDVKGGVVNEASIVRIKTAATKFPLWRFRIVSKVKKKYGDWKIREL